MWEGYTPASLPPPPVVEVTGVPVDIAVISHPNDGTVLPPVVAGRPLANQLTGLAATPTPEAKQQSYANILLGSSLQGIVPLIILSSYYRGGWSTAYCEETGLAQWAFVFACVGLGGVLWQFLINVWFWRINWKHYTTGGEAAVIQTGRRKGRLDLSQLLLQFCNFVWFCSGQGARTRVELARTPTHAHTHARSAGLIPRSHRAAGMVWSTVGCEDAVYDNITSGVWPGCAKASDGKHACGIEPRPGCCYEPMHEFARVYSIFVFALCGIITPCLICVVCFQVGPNRKARNLTARPRQDLPISESEHSPL
jgi:hypothetical protein